MRRYVHALTLAIEPDARSRSRAMSATSTSQVAARPTYSRDRRTLPQHRRRARTPGRTGRPSPAQSPSIPCRPSLRRRQESRPRAIGPVVLRAPVRCSRASQVKQAHHRLGALRHVVDHLRLHRMQHPEQRHYPREVRWRVLRTWVRAKEAGACGAPRRTGSAPPAGEWRCWSVDIRVTSSPPMA